MLATFNTSDVLLVNCNCKSNSASERKSEMMAFVTRTHSPTHSSSQCFSFSSAVEYLQPLKCIRCAVDGNGKLCLSLHTVSQFSLMNEMSVELALECNCSECSRDSNSLNGRNGSTKSRQRTNKREECETMERMHVKCSISFSPSNKFREKVDSVAYK